MEDLKNQGFKLLAIQPRKGCHADFRKVLKEGEIYSFYPSYEFKRNKAGEVTEIIAPKHEPRLYDIGNLSVNISAVVGKNGSGKSTLIELLYYAVYFLSTALPSIEKNNDNPVLLSTDSLLQKELEGLEKKTNRLQRELKKEREAREGLDDELSKEEYLSKYEEITLLIQEKENEFEKLNERIEKLRNEIPQEKKSHQKIVNKLKLSIYYLLEGKLIELQIDDNISTSLFAWKIKQNSDTIQFTPSDKKPVNDYSFLDNFFYTVAINYSHYALNSNSIGKWIERLFHKNDAYTAPVVINPMRKEGGFNINEENSFAKYRLLLYVILEYRKLKSDKDEKIDKQVTLTEHQHVHAIRFTLNSSKTDDVPLRMTANGFSGANEYSLALSHIHSAFFNDDMLQGVLFFDKKFPFKEELYKYLAKKWVQIRRTYKIYGERWNDNELLDELSSDNTHITFKLNQAVNFIKQCIDSEHKASIWKNPNTSTSSQPFFDLDLETLNQWLPQDIKDPVELMKYLPPPIFDIDFLFAPKLNEGNAKQDISRFSALSSGEQQLIHSIQSVLYHLNNLRSAHHGQDGRQKYEVVNIIYDEIELYFHPDYQRKFIHEFLNAIERLNLFFEGKGIKHINILFSTHSPFVLSDIPSTNILRLKEGRPESETDKSKTFGANIYSLLKDSFFLDAYIGKHAKIEIQKLINTLSDKPPKENSDLPTDKKLEESSELLKERIEMIGEPFLRDKLLEMYYNKFGQEERIKDLQRELDRLRGGREL